MSSGAPSGAVSESRNEARLHYASVPCELVLLEGSVASNGLKTTGVDNH